MFIPPIGLLFCAFASLVFFLIVAEARSAKALLEAQALQTTSDLVESFRTSSEGSIEPLDSRVLSFGIYRQDGMLAAGFGDAPPWSSPSVGDKELRYDDARQTLTVLRPLIAESSHRLGNARPPIAGGGYRFEAPLRPVNEIHHGPDGSLYMTLDISGYYRKHYVLGVTSILAPLVTLMIGALFISLLLKNLKYRASAEKRETLAFLGESARTLVHEIRNPLGAIRLQLGVLRRKFPVGEVPEVEAIEEETDRLNLLVRRISDFLKNPAGSPTRVDLASFLRDFALRHMEGLRLGAVDGGAAVRFDPELLRSVLENLVRNAQESYAEDDPDKEAILSLSIRGSVAILTVSDRGKGIADGLRERIFDPFFTDKAQGSGIGLPLARRFVEAAGGSLRLESRKGGGTEARIMIPLEKREK